MHVATAPIAPAQAALVEDCGRLVLVLDESTPPPLVAALRRVLIRVDGKISDG